ncbi:MAG: hypothetical protein ABEJ75_01325 [Candidatus Nanohaloarchaea archaeon]
MKNLYRVSVLLAATGLALMYIGSARLAPVEVDAADIDESLVGDIVKINGTIQDYYTNDDTEFFTLKDSTGSIRVVNFDPVRRKGLGRPITVSGEVSLYQGELELVVREVY